MHHSCPAPGPTGGQGAAASPQEPRCRTACSSAGQTASGTTSPAPAPRSSLCARNDCVDKNKNNAIGYANKIHFIDTKDPPLYKVMLYYKVDIHFNR